MSLQDTLLGWTPSHFNQLPCFFIEPAATCLVCSINDRTSLCTIFLFSISDASPQLALVTHPSPTLPEAVVPTMSLSLSLDSASFTALSALHFRPVLTSTRALLTFSSMLSRNIMTCLTLVTLNSSVTEENEVVACCQSYTGLCLRSFLGLQAIF